MLEKLRDAADDILNWQKMREKRAILSNFSIGLIA